jgi:hypothetical protein
MVTLVNNSVTIKYLMAVYMSLIGR